MGTLPRCGHPRPRSIKSFLPCNHPFYPDVTQVRKTFGAANGEGQVTFRIIRNSSAQVQSQVRQRSNPRQSSSIASFPGPAQLSVACSADQATESWAGPGNEASSSMQFQSHLGNQILYEGV